MRIINARCYGVGVLESTTQCVWDGHNPGNIDVQQYVLTDPLSKLRGVIGTNQSRSNKGFNWEAQIDGSEDGIGDDLI